MKRILYPLVFSTFMTSCFNTSSGDQVLSQTFVHKYGFETTPEEWDEREQDGQVVSLLKNGVKVIRSYQNGQLHGLTTYTFPNSAIIEKALTYDLGTLLKETVSDPSGMPIREEMYEFDNRTVITLWDSKGVPLSIEEYEDELLISGKYYTSDLALEEEVVNGFGQRIKRDRTGLLVSCDTIKNGVIASRSTYHPNGNIHTVSNYHDYQLHGEQSKFTASGKPLMEITWNHGIIDGPKITYRNGMKVAEIPYVNGQKHGTELHFDDLGNLTAEIEWKNDKKHGTTKLFSEEATETEWFFNGKVVNGEKFKFLEDRDHFFSEFPEGEVR